MELTQSRENRGGLILVCVRKTVRGDLATRAERWATYGAPSPDAGEPDLGFVRFVHIDFLVAHDATAEHAARSLVDVLERHARSAGKCGIGLLCLSDFLGRPDISCPAAHLNPGPVHPSDATRLCRSAGGRPEVRQVLSTSADT